MRDRLKCSRGEDAKALLRSTPHALGLLIIVLDVAFVIHAAKTGRMSPWAYIILMLPGIGAIAYVLVELLPERLGSYKGRQAQEVVPTLARAPKHVRTSQREWFIQAKKLAGA